jgi:hypothetical protein
MLNLYSRPDLTVENAYIITLRGNDISENLSARCQYSCEVVNQPYSVWQAFDGTSGEIKIPENLKNESWLKWIKVYDDNLSITEISCYLSHLSLWVKCVEIDKPIVILEHDSIVVKRYPNHIGYNQIAYLGCHEQQVLGWKVSPCPPFGSNGKNYKFILRAHAYAVDPQAAKNLIGHTIKNGIVESLDVAIRADNFSIIQPGLFAYDQPSSTTTITDRKKQLDGAER